MKKRKKRAKKGEPQRVTFAVTHIRLGETNAGKLTALDALAQVYLALTQQYVTLFGGQDCQSLPIDLEKKGNVTPLK